MSQFTFHMSHDMFFVVVFFNQIVKLIGGGSVINGPSHRVAMVVCVSDCVSVCLSVSDIRKHPLPKVVVTQS